MHLVSVFVSDEELHVPPVLAKPSASPSLLLLHGPVDKAFPGPAR